MHLYITKSAKIPFGDFPGFLSKKFIDSPLLLARMKKKYYNNTNSRGCCYRQSQIYFLLWEVIGMLRHASFFGLFFWNSFIIGIWTWVTFLLCERMPEAMLDPQRPIFVAHPWEHGGRWYRDSLKIQLWKDRLPQHIGKGGFSKKHMTSDSISYLDAFIRETCRGEWMHRKNLFSAVIMLIVDPPLVGLLGSLFVVLANLPFAIVQRYNRFRLQTLRKRRLRTAGAAALEQSTVTA